MRALLRHALIAFGFVSMPLAAQVPHPGIGVRVRAPGVLFERFQGVYLGRSGDTLLVGNDERGPVRIPMSAVTQLDISRGRSRWKGALSGALWGGAVGLAFGAVVAAADTTDDVSASEALGIMVAGGVELGAIIGVIVGRRVWVPAQPSILMGASPFDRRRPGIRLALRAAR
jgi:hypothetical protein